MSVKEQRKGSKSNALSLSWIKLRQQKLKILKLHRYIFFSTSLDRMDLSTQVAKTRQVKLVIGKI